MYGQSGGSVKKMVVLTLWVSVACGRYHVCESMNLKHIQKHVPNDQAQIRSSLLLLVVQLVLLLIAQDVHIFWVVGWVGQVVFIHEVCNTLLFS